MNGYYNKPTARKLFIILLLQFLSICQFNADPLVQVQQGILNGTVQKSRKGRNYTAFLGIPYAQPPIGNLRFSNPVPAKNWNGVRQADSFGSICSQRKNNTIIGTEDCLFLNVYTPILKFNSLSNNNTLLPVMFWIHGGGFVGGSSNDHSAEFLLDKDIILITINYRLGIFGFFSTADSAAPGNFGMKDQILALKWVQKNIKYFGGDPNKVTIFGESAGGASVSLHAISKASNGLFQQYIIQSGSSLCPWAYQKKANFILYVRKISALLFCPFINSQEIVDCLRKRSVESLFKTSSIFGTISRFAQLTWTPTDEDDHKNAFLTNSPKKLIEMNQMKDLPFMSGVVTDEGLLVTSSLYASESLAGFIKRISKLLIAYVNKYYIDSDNNLQLTTTVNNFYFNKLVMTGNDTVYLRNLTRYITDSFFHYPQLKMLEQATPKMNNSNYFYSFGYRGTYSVVSGIDSNKNIGVSHAEELLYLFPADPDKFPVINNTDRDEFVTDLMIDLWTSFAINGKPTSEKLTESNLWSPYNSEKNTHLQIGNINNNTDPSVTLSHSFNTGRMNFWKEVAPNFFKIINLWN